MKDATISWRKLDDGEVLVKHNDREIGTVYHTIIGGKWKWIMKPFFKIPLNLKNLLKNSYDSEIEAGKKMSKLWAAVSGRFITYDFADHVKFLNEFENN